MHKYFIIASVFWVLGCATADPARYIMRKCPVKRVYGEDASFVVMRDIKYDGRYVYVIGECLWDTRAIKEWCDVEGIDAVIVSLPAKVGRKVIQNGHRALLVNNKLVDYQDGIGIIARRADK